MELHRNLARHIAVVGVVDDDPAVRNSLKFSLGIEGFAVAVYRGAAELLNDSDLSRFSCLVIDQYMPGMNGLDLVSKLRQHQVKAPVILITTHPPRALIDRAREAAVEIVEKPLLGNSLVDRIHDLIAPPAQPSTS
jgi:FixJ family two-component response regulator